MDRVKEGIRVARKNKKIAAREKRLLQEGSGGPDSVPSRDLSGRRILKSIAKLASRRPILPSRLRLKATQPKPKSFFTRFVEGYTLVEREGEAKNEQLTSEISNWFGRQGTTTPNSTTAEES